MKFSNEALVSAGIDEVFAALNDPAQIVSFVPDAELVETQGDEHVGRVKIKIGPISASFLGRVVYVESSFEDKRIVVRGSGSDEKGNGTAEATVVITLGANSATETALRVDTDLLIQGKFVQFGKTAVSAVAKRILEQFAKNMSTGLSHVRSQGSNPGIPTQAASAPESTSNPTVPTSVRPQPVPWWKWIAVFVAGCIQGWILTRAFGGKR